MALGYIRRLLGRNLANPSQSPAGRIVLKLMIQRNTYLEKAAVKHMNIQANDHVLEVGFGHGLGLQFASKLVFAGGGKLYGVDISEQSHEEAEERLHEEICRGQVELYKCSVEHLPLNNASIDKIFHCNSFYFWPDVVAGCAELHRVLKPGCPMLTVQNIPRVLELKRNGTLKHANTDFVGYMSTLEHVGFTDVKVEYYTDEETNLGYQCISAVATK